MYNFLPYSPDGEDSRSKPDPSNQPAPVPTPAQIQSQPTSPQNSYHTYPYNFVPQPQYAPVSANPYAHPAYHVPPSELHRMNSSGKAVISLIVSVFALLGAWWLPIIGLAVTILVIVFGHKALSEMHPYNTARGIAIGGLICGYIALGFACLSSLLWLIFSIPDLFSSL